jgi:hypothetical protein
MLIEGEPESLVSGGGNQLQEGAADQFRWHEFVLFLRRSNSQLNKADISSRFGTVWC